MRNYFVKRKIEKGLLLLCVLLAVGQMCLGASFKESGGMLVLEAENYDAMRADTASGQVWELRTDETPDAASNGAYMQSPKPNTNDTNYGHLNEAVAESPRLDYVCQLEGGTYAVWARGTNDGSGSDTIHFGINFNANGLQDDGVNNTIDGIDFDENGFMWSKKTQYNNGSSGLIVATAGEYIINVYQRENGARFDKLIITSDLDYTPTGFGPDETASAAGAHSPTPTGTWVDTEAYTSGTSVTWMSPLQDADGNPLDPADMDPNLISADSYDITYYVLDNAAVADDDPNWITNGVTVTGVTSPYALTFSYEQTVYWIVDTHVTWDSAGVDFPPVVVGSDWQFTTRPSYVPPTVTLDNVITSLDITTALSPTPISTADVTQNSDVIDIVTWTVLVDDVDYPAGSDAVVTDTTVDKQYPTAGFTTTVEGTYRVKLEITDDPENHPVTGDPVAATTVEVVAEIVVYADGCQAKKDSPGGWDQNDYDFDGDCLVDLLDLSGLTGVWLNDTGLKAQEDTTPRVGYVPASAYAARIEAEWAALGPQNRIDNHSNWATIDDLDMYGDDPNSCQNWPMEFGPSNAPSVEDKNGDKVSGYATDDGHTWLDFKVNVLAAGVPVDVYAGYSTSRDSLTMRFSNVDEPIVYPADPVAPETLYDTCAGSVIFGTCTVPGTGGWGNFYDNQGGVYIGTVTFNDLGEQRVRVATDDLVNFDWFSFDF